MQKKVYVVSAVVITISIGIFIFVLSRLYMQPVFIPKSPIHANPTHTPEIQIPVLSLENFYDDIHVTQYPRDEIRTIIVTGDIIPGRSVNSRTLGYNNFHWAFEPTASFLKNADLTYINLESPLIAKCPVTNDGMIFCGDRRHVEGFVYAGVDVANLANNHLGNHGAEGIKQTAQYLQERGIVGVGIENNPQYVDVRGLTIAFLGYDDIEVQTGVSRADMQTIQREIQEARSQADIVIVQFHWGVEYVAQPTDRQRELGKLAIDSGADLVIGNHPHWIQPVELYNGKLITYAHGNFIFDQMWSEKTREGIVGKYYFYKNHLVDVEYVPIKIEDYGQAHIIQDEIYKKRILNDMYQESVFLRDKTN
ncbi:MAG TPA: CapA family protein [Candidatus Levybacteria bacterium]|nr:CapA family protein [Candidatus Levybacteria bacterium]